MSSPLRVSLWLLVLSLALGVLVVAGLILPLGSAQMAETNPEYAHLAWPYLILCWVACVAALAALAAAVWLVELAASGRLLSQTALRPLALATGAFATMAVVFLGINAHLTFVVGQNHPSLFWALLGLGLITATAALALVAARTQVTRAAALADEAEAFI